VLSHNHPGHTPDPINTLPETPPAPDDLGTAEHVRVPGYEILSELGRGGMGVVYKARQAALGRTVALKMILAGGHTSPDNLARFKDEARAVARLQHPNIVQIHEVGDAGGLPFFSLELCEGGSLEALLDGTPWLPGPAAALVETLARAMDAAHRQHVIHRDLKPANVLLASDVASGGREPPECADAGGSRPPLAGFVPKIGDFGLAKRLDEAGRTASGAIVGTPSYMAPEQAAGRRQDIGPTTDVYALGAILYELLTGRPPFKAATALDTVLQVLGEEPVPPRRLNPQVPRDLETICLKCLQKEPGRRYESALALAEDLCRFQASEPIRARPVGALGRALKWARRRPAAAALAAVGALLLLLLPVVAVYVVQQQRVRAERDVALTNEAEAQTQRGIAEAEHERAEQLLYARQLALAQSEWEAGNVTAAFDLLASTRPESRGWEYRHLYHRFHHLAQRTMYGHDGVVSVCFSPDGERITSSGAGTVRVWDARTGRVVSTAENHARGVLSPDGKRIASTSLGDNLIRVFDARTGRQALELKGHRGWVKAVAFSPDGKTLASAAARTVRLWDAITGQKLLAIEGHVGDVSSVCFSPDGRHLASGGGQSDRTVRVWDARTGRELLVLRGHSGWVWSVAFSPDGRRIASGSDDTTVRVWDARTGKQLFVLKKHTGPVYSVCFSPDGRRLASASKDGTVSVWDADNPLQGVLLLKGYAWGGNSVCFSPDGQRLASPGEHEQIQILDARTGFPLLALKGHADGVHSISFSPDGERLASGGWEGRVRVWDARTGKQVQAFWANLNQVDSVCFSPDGRLLGTGSYQNDVRLWDARTGRKIRELEGNVGGVYSVCFSPDGKRVASGHGSGTVLISDTRTGQKVLTLKGHVEPVFGLCFSPDGKWIASGAADSMLNVWNASTGQKLFAIKGHTGIVRSVCFSPDGQRLASAGEDGMVRLWHARAGHEILALKGHAREVRSVCFSPDGQRMAFASGDGTLEVLDAPTGPEVLVLKGHTGEVTSVYFSRDGKRLTSVSRDTTIVWDVRTGRPIPGAKPVAGRYDPRSPDGKLFAHVEGATIHLIPLEKMPPPLLVELDHGLRFHTAEAADSEMAGDWFAAAFHLGQLIKLRLWDIGLHLRQVQAMIRLADAEAHDRMLRADERK
jgi:WD40 repeat protein